MEIDFLIKHADIVGRPRLRWEDVIREDLGEMKIQNWIKMIMDEEAWKRTVEQAKAHNELEHQKKRPNSILTVITCGKEITKVATYRSSNLSITLRMKYNYIRPNEWWWNGRGEREVGFHTCRWDRPLVQLPPRHSTDTERPKRG